MLYLHIYCKSIVVNRIRNPETKSNFDDWYDPLQDDCKRSGCALLKRITHQYLCPLTCTLFCSFPSVKNLCKNYLCLMSMFNSFGRWYVVIIWGTSDGYAISNLLFFKTYLHSLLILQTILMYMTYNLPTPPISTRVFRSREPTPTTLDSSGGTNKHIPVQNFTALVI